MMEIARHRLEAVNRSPEGLRKVDWGKVGAAIHSGDRRFSSPPFSKDPGGESPPMTVKVR